MFCRFISNLSTEKNSRLSFVKTLLGRGGFSARVAALGLGGGSPSLGFTFFRLLHAVRQQLGVGGRFVTSLLGSLLLDGQPLLFALDDDWSDQSLDLGSFRLGLLA